MPGSRAITNHGSTPAQPWDPTDLTTHVEPCGVGKPCPGAWCTRKRARLHGHDRRNSSYTRRFGFSRVDGSFLSTPDLSPFDPPLLHTRDDPTPRCHHRKSEGWIHPAASSTGDVTRQISDEGSLAHLAVRATLCRRIRSSLPGRPSLLVAPPDPGTESPHVSRSFFLRS